MLSQVYWLSLKPEVRAKLALILGLNKSDGVVVQNNQVISDGYTATDLSVVTVETLQQVTKSNETDFYKLLESLIASLEAPMIEIVKADPAEVLNETNDVAELPVSEPKTLYPRPKDQKVKVMNVTPTKKKNK